MQALEEAVQDDPEAGQYGQGGGQYHQYEPLAHALLVAELLGAHRLTHAAALCLLRSR